MSYPYDTNVTPYRKKNKKEEVENIYKRVREKKKGQADLPTLGKR
jgi:hypothetical protein